VSSASANLISEGVPQTQITLLIPVVSSKRRATAGGHRLLPWMMWLRKSGPILADLAIERWVIFFSVGFMVNTDKVVDFFCQ
jgi:hypothetical protein